ncbi:hypothetical protein H4R99_004641 [Coemansia sp. RSA 1722]|nr:hypothetical protein LPJ57_001524 [Coemansia sp. RSA 486]KAJ2231762.1 hypothetical protein IWW45_005404 [Coemansia sp. RSA 485]KAJ2597106.1 hypothetical protein H4R99_004641 [Coemansia sp. RSA 1722]
MTDTESKAVNTPAAADAKPAENADAKSAENADAQPTTAAETTVNSASQSRASVAGSDSARKDAGLSKEEAGVESDGKDGAASDGETIDRNDGKRNEKDPGAEKSILGSMSTARMVLTMTALGLAVFISSLDQTIVAGSLPTIGKQFDALGSVSWVTTGFLLASTAMQPLYGRLSDIFGRIETLISGLLVFLAGSAISGASTSMGMLIGGRVVQGLGASSLMSLSMVIISDISIERERGKITSVFSAVWAASSALGPVFGGVFSQSRGGWPWVFYFSLPVGGLSGIFILLFLRLPRPKGSFKQKLRRVDFLGIAVLVGGIVMLLLALSFGGDSHAWDSPTVLCLLVFSLVTVGVFVLVEWKIPSEPIMPLRLFKNANVGITLIQQIFLGATMFGPIFFIPIFFSVVMNSTPITAGLHLLPLIMPVPVVSFITGFTVYKTGRYRELQWLGGVIMTAGVALLILLDENTTTGKSIGIMFLPGLGMGFMLQPMLLTLQTSIQGRDMATGTTLFVAIRSLGGSIGLAILQTVYNNVLKRRLDSIVLLYPQFVALIEASVNNQSLIHGEGVPAALRQDVTKAYVHSLRYVFYSTIPFAAMTLVLGLFIKHIPLRTSMIKTAGNSSEKVEKK